MSLGPIMLDLKGIEISQEEREHLLHPLVGGVILFSRNYESIEQLIKLVQDIHNIRSPQLLVAVDHEGGRVQRFRDGFTHMPAVNSLMTVYDKDNQQALRLADTCGWLMAVELRAVGIDFSFAPVLDLDLGISDVIVDRAFHRDPDVVAKLALAYMQGMARAGMVATGKHFPGHGAVKVDSHVDFPVDNRELETIYMQDVKPFEYLIKKGLAGIMPAHVIYPKVDPHPAGFSRFWLSQVLRERLQFQGVIFSDDLSMKAASVAGDVVDRANAAVKAGCDMALVCNDPEAAVSVLDNLGEHHDPVSHVRLGRMQGKHFVNRNKMLKDPDWHAAVNAIQVLR